MAIKTIQDYEKEIEALKETITIREEQLAQKEKKIYDLLDKNEMLDTKFDSKAWTISTVIAVYAIIVTIFEAFKSPVLFEDIVSAVEWIKYAIISIFSFGLTIASFINQIFSKLPFELIASMFGIIVIALIEILLFGVVSGTIIAFLYGMYKKGNSLYRSRDSVWVTFTLLSFAIAIFWGSQIKAFCNINLLLLIFIMQIAFVIIRRRYQYKHPQY